MEIHLRNPWLTYGIGLHRLREAGLLPEIFGRLDEQPLTLDQLHEFCKTFLVGDNRCIDLPHPRSSWNGFFETLRFLIDKEKNQWNPVKKKVMPWIDLDKLLSIHGGRKKLERRHTMLSHSINDCQTKESTKFHFRRSTSSNKLLNESQRISSRTHHPRHRSMEPQGSYEFYQHNSRESIDDDCPRSLPPNKPKMEPGDFHAEHQHRHHSKKSIKDNLRSDSHPSNSEKYPHLDRKQKSLADLHNFILEAPLMFPPNNTMVEPHEYFTKWEAFVSEGCIGVSGDELTKLLLRGMWYSPFNACLLYCLMSSLTYILSLFFDCDFCNGGDDVTHCRTYRY